MALNKVVALMFFSILIAGCETVATTSQSSPETSATSTTTGKTFVGDARMASFLAPKDCEKISLDTLRSGGSKRVRSGCVVQSGEAMVVVGLNETTTPFDEAFSVSGGAGGDFQDVAAAFPREMLSDYVVKLEKSALASGSPGWRYSNKRSKLMSGNGGVDGASACTRFSFDGVSTAGPSRKSQVTGLRFARFGASANTVQEVMLEVMSFYPAGQKAPERFRGIVDQATMSLRYR